MKVELIEKNNKPQNTAFKGFMPVKSPLGYSEYEFNYTFDDKQYDCYLELSAVEDDGKGNYVNKRALKNFDTGSTSYKLICGANRIDVAGSYNLAADTPFAYHYRLTPKNQPDNTLEYGVDAGDVIDFRKDGGNHLIFNLVVPKRSRGTKSGSGLLGIPDSYNAMYAYDKDGKIVFNEDYINKIDMVNSFSSKVGGSFAGLVQDLRDGKLDKYSKIYITPFATDDSLTPHSYWNKNCFQMVQSLGNIDNYAELQKELFVRDKNLVSDAALVNEGLEGIHFNHMLKWGKNSYAYNWFRADLNLGPLGLGVLAKEKEFITHKIINSPYIYTQGSDGKVHIKKAPIWKGEGSREGKYDPKSPTFIQILDKEIATDKEKNDKTKRVDKYSNPYTGNPYKKLTHNDTVILYSHEIDPETYNDNIKRLNEYNASHKNNILRLDSVGALRILSKFKYFNYDGKIEGGKEDWDANVDVAKLNYVFSNYNSTKMKHLAVEGTARDDYKYMILRKNAEVQDYAISSAMFWTKKTNQILNLHVAQTMKNVKAKNAQNILDLIKLKTVNKSLPPSVEFSVDKNVIQNLLDGNYNLHGMDTVESFRDITIANMMELPLDSIEFGDNLAGVFASPYLTKRATKPEQIGVSRFELMKQNNPHLTGEYDEIYNSMNYLYKKEMSKFAQDILKRLNEKLDKDQKLDSNTNATKYGKYVLPFIAPEIAKFAIVKGLFPDIETGIRKNGGISYDYNALKQTSLQSLEIKAGSPDGEAKALVEKMKKRIPAIKNADKELLVDALYKMIEGTDLTSFKLAEMIVDRTQAGLDWRLDAVKDIMDKESLMGKKTDFERSWNQVSSFWKKFAQNIYKENANSYIVAEVTDQKTLHDKGEGYYSDKFFFTKDIVMKFLRETGITSTANYDFFFTDIPGIFSKCYEKYEDRGVMQGTKIYELLKKDGADFLHSGPLDSIMYSYNFIDNHDKPRALHMMALDAELFYSNLNVNTYDKDINDKQYKEKEKAFRVLNNRFFGQIDKGEVDRYNFMKKSTKAIAMGDALNNSMGRALSRLEEENVINPDQRKHIYEAIAASISDLANGSYLGKNYVADAFGTRPFDITIQSVINQAKAKHGLQIDKNLENNLKKTSFYMSLDPAISKLLGIMKFLVAVPGIPTMFAGDDIGSTGYEELTRNIYLQNRSVIHHEWLDDGEEYSLKFINDHKKEFDDVMGLRKRPELHALNDGAPVLLQLQGGKFNQDGKDIDIKLPAILRQSTDGTMAVSIFNTVGVTHDYDKYNDPAKYPVTIGGINLDYNSEDSTGIQAGLPDGTVFVNANNKDEKFIVKREDKHYYIAHEDNSPIVLTDNTLNIYHVPLHVQSKIDNLKKIQESIKPDRPRYDKPFKIIKKEAEKNKNDKTSFKGSSISLYNPQYNLVSNLYTTKELSETGSKLSLVSR